MTPIDDELRAALHGRAAGLTPAPDPLAGIERRAKQIQRNRIAAAVAGSALAVAAVAAVVPALQSAGAPTGPRPPTLASAEPTLVPAPVSYALDPTDPWAFRGVEVDEGTRATIQRDYATRVQGAEVLVTPLFAQVWEPSQQLEVVFLAEVDGAYRWGVAAATESGPEFRWDAQLTPRSTSLAAALPGDEVGRLLVVASPDAVAIDYAPQDASGYAAMGELERGVATVALDGDPVSDAYRVTLPAGSVIDEAPDLPGAEAPVTDDRPGTDTPLTPDAAGYGLDLADPWDYRGPMELTTPELPREDEALFTAKHGGGWTTRPLYAAQSDAGVSLLVVLHTKDGEAALVSTTWQRGDRAAEQSDQVVDPGQLLIQSLVPTDLDDGSSLVVALASPTAGGIVLETPSDDRPDGITDPGVGLWAVDAGDTGTILLFTEGDGLEYYAEPALQG